MLACAADDLRANARAENRRGAPCYQCLKGGTGKSPRKNTDRECATWITRDGIPVFALVLKSSGFSFKARYVNDVHLPRFGLSTADATRTSRLRFTRLYTRQPPAARCTTGIQRISHRASALLRKLGFASADSPRTVGMIAKRRFCVNCRTPTKLARGV